MKKAKPKIALLVVLILAFAAYITLPDVVKLAIRSIIDTPICDSRIANKLGIESPAVRDYVIESLDPGMTPAQIEETLAKIAPISRIDTSVEADKSVYSAIRVNLCYNPLGDLVLDIHYSKDGKLISAEDAWADQ